MLNLAPLSICSFMQMLLIEIYLWLYLRDFTLKLFKVFLKRWICKLIKWLILRIVRIVKYLHNNIISCLCVSSLRDLLLWQLLQLSPYSRRIETQQVAAPSHSRVTVKDILCPSSRGSSTPSQSTVRNKALVCINRDK